MMTLQQEIELIKHYVGCSLKNRTDELGELVSCGVDDPKTIVRIKTNCGLFARGIFKRIGIEHPILEKKYVIGHAISDLIQIGKDLGIYRKFDGKNLPTAGALMMYCTSGKNDNHVEFLLGTPNDKKCADHVGGGRENNEIGFANSLITWSVGRPLTNWWDVQSILLDEAA